MPRGKPFPPGHSGNPAGRPPKARALTDILEAAGNTTLDLDGKRVAQKRLTAAMLWQGATTGRVAFPDGSMVELAPADWLALVKWLYTHIDGPPKAEVGMELSGPDGSQPFAFIFTERAPDAGGTPPAAARVPAE